MPAPPSPARPCRALAGAPLIALALSLAPAACGDDDATPSDAGGATQTPPVDSEAVIYVGGPTDETYRNVAGLPPVVDARAASFTAPAAGQALRADTPPAFAWQAVQAAAARPARPSLWARAWEALVERPAYAHGMPYTGVAYLLSVRSASGTPLLTTLTTETSFTPEPAAWSAAASAGGDVSVTLVSSRFEQNAVVGGGPWAPPSGPLTLSIAPLARFAPGIPFT